MNQLHEPLEALSSALGAALHRDLPDIAYRDRDWERYIKWRKANFATLPIEEKRRLYKEERATGIGMGPPDLYVDKLRRPRREEVSVIMFPQTWASTALGYGGVGGAAMTTAYTVVVSDRAYACVYFGSSGRLAYRVAARSVAFLEDLHIHKLVPARAASARYGEDVLADADADGEDAS